MIRTCKFCGKPFVLKSLKGNAKNREHCYKAECELKQKRDCARRYAEKNREIVKNVKYENNENFEDNIVCEKAIVIDEGYGELIGIARELGALRFKLIEKIKVINERVGNTNGIEQDLLHKLENMDKLTAKEAIDISVQLKKNRNERRVDKNMQYLIGSFLDKIQLTNPEQFVRTGIEMCKSAEYEPRVLKEEQEEKVIE